MDCIVLKKRDFREFDQIISVFSEKFGKIDLLARGIKKIKSKNSAFLEPFSFVDIEILPGKEFLYVGSVYPKNFFKNIRIDYKKSFLVAFLLDFLLDFLKENEEDIKLFELLKKWLRVLDNFEGEFQSTVFVDTFMVKFFSILGFMPQLHKCINCQKKYNKNLEWGFDVSNGGIICNICFVGKKTIEKLSEKQRKELIFLLQKSFPEIFEVKYNSVHNLVFDFVVSVAEKDVYDWVSLAV